MGCDFISAMPTNLYGPGDNFDLNNSHVVPALIRKAHEAKARNQAEMVIWGSGTPRREFLHVDDAADALVRLMTHYSGESHVNVGSGSEVSILELAELVARVVGFSRAGWSPIPRSLTARRASCSISSKLTSLGWRPASNWQMVSRVPMPGLSKHADDALRAAGRLSGIRSTASEGVRLD